MYSLYFDIQSVVSAIETNYYSSIVVAIEINHLYVLKIPRSYIISCVLLAIVTPI